jgi:ABC-type transport system involved in cytochrome c biogenesis permease subunit
LLTVGIVAGALWANRSLNQPWGGDPKIIWSLITWVIYAILIHYRLSSGLRGRRAALMSIVGFVLVLVTFTFFRHQGSAHSFIQQ